MKPKSLLPLPLFRLIAFALLAAAVAVWLGWIIRDADPYHWLQQRLLFIGQRESQLIGGLGAFILVFLVWTVPVSVLRGFTDLPPLRQALTLANFQEEWQAQRRAQAEALDLPGDDPARRAFFRRLGWIGVGVGLGGWLITGVAWTLSGRLWETPLAVGLVGVLGGLISVLSGRAGMFDRPKLLKLKAVTQRLLVITVVAMIVLGIVIVLAMLLINV